MKVTLKQWNVFALHCIANPLATVGAKKGLNLPGMTTRETKRSVTARARRSRLGGWRRLRTQRTEATTRRLPRTDIRMMPAMRITWRIITLDWAIIQTNTGALKHPTNYLGANYKPWQSSPLRTLQSSLKQNNIVQLCCNIHHFCDE